MIRLCDAKMSDGEGGEKMEIRVMEIIMVRGQLPAVSEQVFRITPTASLYDQVISQTDWEGDHWPDRVEQVMVLNEQGELLLWISREAAALEVRVAMENETQPDLV